VCGVEPELPVLSETSLHALFLPMRCNVQHHGSHIDKCCNVEGHRMLCKYGSISRTYHLPSGVDDASLTLVIEVHNYGIPLIRIGSLTSHSNRSPVQFRRERYGLIINNMMAEGVLKQTLLLSWRIDFPPGFSCFSWPTSWSESLRVSPVA